MATNENIGGEQETVSSALQSFRKTMRALRQIATVAPAAGRAELQRQVGEERKKHLADFRKAASDKERSSEIVKEFQEIVLRSVDAMKRDISAIFDGKQEGEPGDDVLIERIARLPTASQLALYRFFGAGAKGAAWFLSEVEIRTSVFVSAVSAFEVLLAQLLTLVLRKYPERGTSSEKTVSTQDLLRFGSLDEMWRHLNERRVRIVMSGNTSQWRKAFRRYAGIDVGDLELVNWPAACECVERRHVLVHAGGKITEQYVRGTRNYPSEGETKPVVGGETFVDDEYLDESFTSLEVLGVLTALILSHELSESPEEWLRNTQEELTDLLEDENWDVAAFVALSLLSQSETWGKRDEDWSIHVLRVFCVLVAGVAKQSLVEEMSEVSDVYKLILEQNPEMPLQWRAAALHLSGKRDDALHLFVGAPLSDKARWLSDPMLSRLRADIQYEEVTT
jgi:hypothetical protein